MRHLNRFNSFRINEGLLDDMKSKVKNFFNKGKKLRKPEEVSREKWNRKFFMYGRLPYTAEEVQFLNKFFYLYHVKFTIPSDFEIDNVDNDDRHPYFSIKIIKLDDEWYLIHHYISTRSYITYEASCNKYYICDEWEEVLGYLSDI
jgi:hypothetical protein